MDEPHCDARESDAEATCVFVRISGVIGLDPSIFDFEVPYDPDGETVNDTELRQRIHKAMKDANFEVGNITPNDIDIDEVHY